MDSRIPRLLITAGEPAGIGPELCLEIACKNWNAELLIVADPNVLKQYAKLLSFDVEIETTTFEKPRAVHKAGTLKVIPVQVREKVIPGELSVANASYVLETLSLATQHLMLNEADALITGPIHKGVINQTGIKFSGHTEFLQEKASSKQVVMMLACPKFRVALVTTHLPIREVADAINSELLLSVLKVLHDDMQQQFKIDNPIIHVCGLNPHAGESGHMGMEEIKVIEPVLEQLRNQGYQLKGPLPADTALTPKGLEGSDVTLAMYHDQGLSVLKYAGFGEAVNITLGLPFIRVSVDHGTALDLAGTGKANSGSLCAAINQALSMVEGIDNGTV